MRDSVIGYQLMRYTGRTGYRQLKHSRLMTAYLITENSRLDRPSVSSSAFLRVLAVLHPLRFPTTSRDSASACSDHPICSTRSEWRESGSTDGAA